MDELATLQYQHPFCDRTGKLLPGDEFVESTTGTGFVHLKNLQKLENVNFHFTPLNDAGLTAIAELP